MQQNAAKTAEFYRRQQILTATPEQLTLMLYNGALKFLNESMKALERKDYEETNHKCIRVQNIISELRSTLKMEYEVAKGLDSLYEYVNRLLVEGNIKSDLGKMEEAKGILTELRDTWHEAMKVARQQKAE